MGELGKEEGGENKSITINVKDQNNNVTQFKIKRDTKMEKVFNAYAQKNGVDVSALRFFLDGVKIGKDMTAKLLDLEDDDQIDVALEQVGGVYS